MKLNCNGFILERKCYLCDTILKRRLFERHMVVFHYDKMKEILDMFLKDELSK